MKIARFSLRATALLVPLVFIVIAAPPIVGQSSVLVIASGLDNPRGLNFGPDGALYVAEAGRGGTSTLCLPLPDQPGTRCYGPTGAITRITGLGVHQRVVTGLPSLAPANGSMATGPQDISFGFGSGWVTGGFGGDPAVRAPFEAAGIQLGWLMQVLPNGTWRPVLDISAYEGTANPDGRNVDSNPFGLRILSDRAVVADAGANALLQIGTTGVVSTLAVFPTRSVPNPFGGPPIQMESVPTSIVEGPDGSLFVGELTGQPFPVGAARIYHVPPGGGTPQVVATGFTTIIDIALDMNSGTGYVLEHDADGIIPPLGPGVAGRVVRINPDGSQTVVATPGLIKPGGIAVGPDGALYITNNSISAGGGQVLRIVP
jgi:hypothetical protein